MAMQLFLKRKGPKIKSPLHILHLEDDPNDAALIQSTLEAGGIAYTTTCVQNRDDFVAALESGGIDLILSDFSLPDLDGLSAVEIVRTGWPDLPVILVSGSLGEERAIDSLKSGATDYVLKERLTRLIPAVRRAMQEVEERAGNRRTEETLRETEQRLQIIFSQSPLGIALVGVDGLPVLTNAALQKMLGYTDEELCRMPFTDFTHTDDCAKDMELYQQLIQGTRRSYQIEKRYIRKDGRMVWARLSVSVAREAAGRVKFAIGMVEDITDRRHLEAQFIAAQKMEVLGQLAGGVAHDFNNILGVIMGYSDLITSNLGPKSPLRKYAEEILHATERAAGLTRQLLVFSRKQTVQPVVIDLNDVVADMDKMLRRLIDENITMTIIPGKQTGRINADSGYVGQVLMNLVVNARDAMPNGGKLTIATSNIMLDKKDARRGVIPGDYVMLSVNDTGTGMSDEVKAHLFEPFFTTKPKGKGTGLGLATCQTIVQLSGGHIVVDSELGKGTTFKVYFPRVEQPLDVAVKQIQTGPLPRGTETLLVVEDEPSVRHLARGVLESQGYEVLSASNGQDALNVAREHKGPPIRLVVTDVIMPLMDGKVMAEWLKTTNSGLKILFTSGYTDDAIAHHGVLEKGIEFLSKPYTPAILARKVRAMLDC
ncbi:MAG TPA: response regulator [Candidatus Angelobacter sp.]|nr:response regulator [Candidatus Angelobacter sp.]